MVKPLADLLGLDDVVATRYGVNDDGTYHGSLDGPFVWSAGKLAAVRRGPTSTASTWPPATPTATACTTRRCWPRSGFPFVVNPDPRMAVMAAARRWPTLDLSAGRQLGWPRSRSSTWRSSGWRSASRIRCSSRTPSSTSTASTTSPRSGPAIIVGNHRSYFDPMAMAVTIARTDRTVRFLGKKEVFDAPIVGSDRGGDGRHPRRSRHRQRRAAEGRRRSPRRRRHGRDHAAGHHPARPGVLRSGAQGPMGRGAAGRDDAARR